MCVTYVCMYVHVYVQERQAGRRTTHKLPATVLEAEAGFIVGCLQDNKTTNIRYIEVKQTLQLNPARSRPLLALAEIKNQF